MYTTTSLAELAFSESKLWTSRQGIPSNILYVKPNHSWQLIGFICKVVHDQTLKSKESGDNRSFVVSNLRIYEPFIVNWELYKPARQ